MRLKVLVLVTGIAAALWSPVTAQDENGVGPADYINARKASMLAIEELLSQLEADLTSGMIGGSQMVVSSGAIAAALEAFPLLFPKDSDLLGTGATLDGVGTAADPRIWQEAESFLALSRRAAGIARQAARVAPVTSLPMVRETCASCHERYVFYDPFAAMGGAGQ